MLQTLYCNYSCCILYTLWICYFYLDFTFCITHTLNLHGCILQMDLYGPAGFYSWDKAAFRNGAQNKAADTRSTALWVSEKLVLKLEGSVSREVARHWVTLFTKETKVRRGAFLFFLILHVCLQSNGLTKTTSLFYDLNWALSFKELLLLPHGVTACFQFQPKFPCSS